MLSRRSIAVTALAIALVGCGMVDVRPQPLAQTCGQWSHLEEDQQLQTAEALVEPSRLSRVREVQQLPADATDRDAYAAVRSSITKVCELERQPGLLLADVIAGLYR